MIHLDTWFAASTAITVMLFGGLIVAKLTERPRIPDVAGFLLFGILLGPSVFGLLGVPVQSEVNQFILNLGATVILFEGGTAVRIGILKKVWISISLLATVGVLVTAACVAVAVHIVFGASWLWSSLLASVIASTDPATLIPVFSRVPIWPRLQQTMETESAVNDATGSVLFFTILAAFMHGGGIDIPQAVFEFFRSAGLGALAGLFTGGLALWLISERGYGIFREFASIVALLSAIGSFTLSTAVHGSGLMAAFVAGVTLGNAKRFRLPLDGRSVHNIEHVVQVMSTIFRMFIFILLGTQVDFALLSKAWASALVVVLVLVFVGRPLTVASSVLVDRVAQWHPREIVFMMWVRETGVIPAALAGVLAANPNIPGTSTIRAVTFVAILFTVVVQASSTGWVAERLKVRLKFAPDEPL